jgi:hypothetical protein
MRTSLILALMAALLPAQPRRAPQHKASPQNKVSELETPVATFHGKLASVSKKDLVLDVGEDQSISFHVSGKTKFLKAGKPIKPAAIAPGSSVTIDGKRDLLGNVDAVTVTVDSAK